VVTGLYNLLSNNTLLNFIAVSNNMKVEDSVLKLKSNNDTSTKIIASNSKTSDSTTNNKENSDPPCLNNYCNINFGDFTLQGVPANLSSLVETCGTASSTNTLFNLFDQISEQLATNGDQEGAKLYKDLANLGYYTASIQLKAEDVANSCTINGVADQNCFFKGISQSTNFALPSNISSLLPSFGYSNASPLSFGIDIADLGKAKYKQITEPNYFYTARNISPAYAMLNIYDQIMNNSNFSDSLKNVTTELYKNIGDMAYQREVALIGAATNGYTGNKIPPQYNPISGELISTPTNSFAGDFKSITHPKTSTNTKLSSTLVCVAGKNKSDTNSCY